jgi:hypothetical protein
MSVFPNLAPIAVLVCGMSSVTSTLEQSFSVVANQQRGNRGAMHGDRAAARAWHGQVRRNNNAAGRSRETIDAHQERLIQVKESFRTFLETDGADASQMFDTATSLEAVLTKFPLLKESANGGIYKELPIEEDDDEDMARVDDGFVVVDASLAAKAMTAEEETDLLSTSISGGAATPTAGVEHKPATAADPVAQPQPPVDPAILAGLRYDLAEPSMKLGKVSRSGRTLVSKKVLDL